MTEFLLKHRWLHRSAYCGLCVLAAFLTLIHPLIHGTPLDSGMLDGILAQLQMMAAHGSVQLDE